MSATQVALGVMTLAALVYTVLAYPDKYGALTGRSRLFRTIGVCLLDLLFLLATMATFIDFTAGVAPRIGPIRALFYLGSCLFLVFSLVAISLLDALESFSTIRRERKGELERILRSEIEKARDQHAADARRKAEDGDPKNDNGSG